MGRTYESMMEELEVIEILSTAYDGDEFPGYENIRLSFSQLETIIRNKRSGWLDALRNQKAVYLITDTSNGKMYVGSATAQYGMLLQRWTNYIDNFIKFENDEKYEIDRVIQKCRAASTKVGGTGIRYTVQICGKPTFLFDEENGKWFVEAKS